MRWPWNQSSKYLSKPKNQRFKINKKAHNNGLFDTIILKLKHFVVEFNDKCFVDFWVDFITFWKTCQ